MGTLTGSSVAASLCLLRETGAGTTNVGGGGGIRILTKQDTTERLHQTKAVMK